MQICKPFVQTNFNFCSLPNFFGKITSPQLVKVFNFKCLILFDPAYCICIYIFILEGGGARILWVCSEVYFNVLCTIGSLSHCCMALGQMRRAVGSYYTALKISTQVSRIKNPTRYRTKKTGWNVFKKNIFSVKYTLGLPAEKQGCQYHCPSGFFQQLLHF